MEKTTIKPIGQEVMHKSPEENVFFDVLSVAPANEQEKLLGNLYVVGHIKYEEEDMGYLVSLISSLAKREYYSETAKSLGEPKLAFEHTLKKLNEVLEEFFQSKKFNLNMGLMAIAGESIFLSRLGKFKVLLGRSGEIIDIFNNINLFQKDHIEEKEFSNIISGKVKLDDAIFAFFPSRSVSAREKQIKEMLLKDSSSEFAEKLKTLSKNAKNFSCCSVHLAIKKVTEMAQVETPRQVEQKIITAYDAVKNEQRAKESKPPEIEKPPISAPAKLAEEPVSRVPLVLKDVSITERDNVFKKMLRLANKIKTPGNLNQLAKVTAISVILVIALVSIFTVRSVFNKDDREAKQIIKQTQENIKLAQNYLSQNDSASARKLLASSLSSLSSSAANEDKSEKLKASLYELLDKVDLVSPEKPQLASDLSSYQGKIKYLAVENGNIYAFDETGSSLLKVSGNESNKLASVEGGEYKMFADKNSVTLFNENSGVVLITDPISRKKSKYSLKNYVPSTDTYMYEQNLYVLSNDSIFKYADALKGGLERQSWLNDVLQPGASILAVDGNAYTLSPNGLLSSYFKGKKVQDFQLSISPGSNSDLLTNKDYPSMVYIDQSLKRVMVFQKDNLNLKKTFKVDEVGDPVSWSLDNNGVLYLLSSDNKIWKLNIE